jgi:hypothetical protein
MYTPPVGWPTLAELDVPVHPLGADQILERVELFSVMALVVNGNDPVYNRRFFVFCAELLKLNADVSLDDAGVQGVASVVSARLDSVPELALYTEDFKRRCLASHRAAARKRLLGFYFARCEDLCDDVIERVLEFV